MNILYSSDSSLIYSYERHHSSHRYQYAVSQNTYYMISANVKNILIDAILLPTSRRCHQVQSIYFRRIFPQYQT